MGSAIWVLFLEHQYVGGWGAGQCWTSKKRHGKEKDCIFFNVQCYQCSLSAIRGHPPDVILIYILNVLKFLLMPMALYRLVGSHQMIWSYCKLKCQKENFSWHVLSREYVKILWVGWGWHNATCGLAVAVALPMMTGGSLMGRTQRESRVCSWIPSFYRSHSSSSDGSLPACVPASAGSLRSKDEGF